MTAGAQASLLPDGQRLHLHHGPIDLVIGVDDAARDACFHQAVQYFETVLSTLVQELPQLRAYPSHGPFEGEIAQAMARAVAPHMGVFVTPMACVAGAVADAVLAAMLRGRQVQRAYVNNGGDIAFHVANGAQFSALGPAGQIYLSRSGGMATSGWRGRSFSLGIADTVTVVAGSAAKADVAATLIANAVDLPQHPGIRRVPAQDISPESDLGMRRVTVKVPSLAERDIEIALQRGSQVARNMQRNGLIEDAILNLQGHVTCLAEHTEMEPLSA